ncbi:LacI family DNA-binding transcriptional regulator [Pseudonocardia sp. MH-G8]|uniref:LacI family DNA-binding transcriptional regulator n=1 Tax=Pseudonocardia sp. MH-G8 TaxID=1854588 RepID=UPI000BA11FC1|nr:LacI family DNA-binding transcriptional regulator [Pseudonocardia sp. MH-G8]OZM75760.1 LacI family transcriptional regulator [Pseudonocardia sp. MH-G8]
MRPTIYDVAREAGVAPSTVSRAFSRPGRVNPDTVQRIRAVAELLGYRTNLLARALPTGKTSMIALVVSDITNPTYFPVIRGAEAAAAEAGFTLLLADAQESQHTEREAIERTLPVIEGMLFSGPRLSDTAIRTAAQQVPVVVLHRAVAGVPAVVTDNALGMRQAVEHLASLGHQSITYVSGPEASWADGERWRAIREACAKLDMRSRRIGPCRPTMSGGVSAVADLRRQPCTAVVAYNDLIAIGLLRGMAQAGVRVPGDVSVVGFDDILGSDFCTPALTTVAAPLRALGTAAVQHLITQARGSTADLGPPIVLPARLVVRGSTAPPGGGQRGRKRISLV